MRPISAGLAFWIACVAPAWAERLPAPAVWESERGVLHITTSTGNGLFAGQYDSRNFGCDGLFNSAGRVSYNRVVFHVDFARCGTFVTWYGFLQGTHLVTKWRLVFTDPLTGQRKFRWGKDILTRAH